MNILDKLLKKRKIEDATQLDDQERLDYDRWRKILSEGEVTVDKIKEFCEMHRGIIEGKWDNMDNHPRKNERLMIAHTIYGKILGIIEAPKHEKEKLELYLQTLVDDVDNN